MEFTLSLTSISGLFLSLAVLAAVPSLSVLMVTSRAVSHGFRHGLLVAVGVVLADMLFIIVALYGLTFFIPWMGQWQWLVRLLAASYLIWWAIQLWNRSTLSHTSPDQSLPASHKNSLLLGFTLTLADTKAILFYIGFLPTWVDSSRLTPFDISIILLITLQKAKRSRLERQVLPVCFATSQKVSWSRNRRTWMRSIQQRLTRLWV